jgi:hypothetical protein
MPDDKLREALERFDALPDDAISPTKITAIITGQSERSVRYHPQLPRHYVSAERYGQRVGDVRQLLRDGWQSLGDAAQKIVDNLGPSKGGAR